jgi:hypothetical protein
MLGLSLRATSAILSAFPAELSHTSVWQDVQALSAHVKRNRPKKIRVLGVDGVYPKLVGKEQPTVIVVDMGTGKPVAVWPIAEKDWKLPFWFAGMNASERANPIRESWVYR